MTIPRTEQIAPMSAIPALVLAGAGGARGARPAAGNGSSIGAVAQGRDQPGRPGTPTGQRMPIRP